MNANRTYEYLTLARQKLFAWVRPLSPGQYNQEFQIGLGSLSRTLTHIMICEWMYMERLMRRDVPAYESWPIRDESPPAFDVLEREWTLQAERTTRDLAGVTDWDVPRRWRSTWEGVTRESDVTAADIATQMILHEVHHRAQAMNMLRHLGVKLDDIDYNEFCWSRRVVASAG